MIKSTSPEAPRIARRSAARLALAFLLALAGSARAQEIEPAPNAEEAPEPTCGAVLIARFDWPTAEFAAALSARILQDGYGCTVEIVRASPEPTRAYLLSARAKQATVAVAPGLPTDWFEGAEAVSIGGLLFAGQEQRGLAVPEWFARARPQLTDLGAVAAAPALFAAPSRTRPTLHLCPVDWPCYEEGRAVARAHGLDAAFELRAAPSGAALAQSLADADSARQPWIGYYWTPSIAASEHPLRFLPASEDAACPDPARDETEPEATAPCAAAFTPRPLAIVYDARLAETAPGAAAALDRLSIPLEIAEATLRWRAETGASAMDAVDRFLETEPALWRAWVDAEAAARIASARSAPRR